MQNSRPKHKTTPDISGRTELKTRKTFISALGLLLMLGALSTLCAVGILYHNKVVSYEILSKQYANFTATLITQEKKAKETERLYEALKSRDYCVGKGGHLVIITSQTEQDFGSSQIGETHWIGLNDLETEGKWMWVNNQPLKETDVMFWYSGPGEHSEPDNWKREDPSGENCAALGDARGNIHKWFDASCKKIF
ncbi:C-type lectin domain family 4 member F-like [Ictalurus furcatus]|uniref:C-type lectin domain family 4 member F-like n=1 Tax=Ictalurus furcatus TaxID=66913 RepID=UPI0023505F68|nr:C-type lectin domain family 4 member F-like [Ictalurus furcatus]XP_053494723.1 C-type lectin domain family 4 member F-like [Ictalurus furcatus]